MHEAGLAGQSALVVQYCADEEEDSVHSFPAQGMIRGGPWVYVQTLSVQEVMGLPQARAQEPFV